MSYLTPTTIRRDRAWNALCACERWSEIYRAKNRAQHEKDRRRRALAVQARGPRAGISAWDQALLAAIEILGERATVYGITRHLRGKGHPNLQEAVVRSALRRLHGVERVTRSENGRWHVKEAA